MSCLCPACSLIPAPTYTEAYRLECEARHVLSMTLDRRRQYLDGMKPERAKPLKREITRQWNANRNAVPDQH